MSTFVDDDAGAFGQGARGKRLNESDVQNRTYDIFWHDLVGRGSSQAGQADTGLMPKRMRDLSSFGSFFDPRGVWQAEQAKVLQAEEDEKKRSEEDEKRRQEEEKKQSRMQRLRKKDGEEDDDDGSVASGAAGGGSVTVADEKWRGEFEPKVRAGLKEVKAAFKACEGDADKAEQLLAEVTDKVQKVWEESASASTKSQKTETEKKLSKLVKEAVKQLKKIGETPGKGKSKSEQIREKNEAKRQEDSVDKDEERVNTVVTKFKKTIISSLMQLKDSMATPVGRLKWMLEVLRWGLEKREAVLVLDCLFTLREMPIFNNARKEVKQRKDERKRAKEKGKKEDKSPMSREAELVKEYSDVIDAAIAKLKGVGDVIEFQMTYMSNRLPPLSRFTFGRSLDPWQKRVLSLMDQNKSVMVCAPTSSGKTVLSSYVTLRAEKILFVVPTEPLVWQVAAMFHHVLGGEVSLVTNQFVYNPTKENPREWRCVVGTPLALESVLSKPRGRIGNELLGKQELHAVRGGFSDFQYAVYDEVHTLDGDEGAALQRIIKAVRCNFLALSATIGNAEALCEWWQQLHDQQVEDEIAEVDAMLRGDKPALVGEGEEGREEGEEFEMLARVVKMRYVDLHPELKDLETVKGKWRSIRSGAWSRNLRKEAMGADGAPEGEEDSAVTSEVNPRDVITRVPREQTTVELIDHKVRFINLQRWVWAGDRLKPLHPLAAVDMNDLKSGGLVAASLPFTPYDSWRLWQALEEKFGEEEDEEEEEEGLLEDVDPEEFLSGERITLEKSKQYEDKLKAKLAALTKTHEGQVAEILRGFAPDSTVMESFSLYDVVAHMKAEGFFPALFFRLDTYGCLELFKALLSAIEAAELAKYPTYYLDLAKKKAEQEERARKIRAAAEKRKDKPKKKRTDDETGERLEADDDDDDGGEVDLGPPVDDTAPHEDFVLASPINRIVATDLDEMLEKLKADNMTLDHPYVKALRRGFGIYVDDSSLQEYPRVVQQLAQQGKLAVVFSDHSLAYGVNMPFRTSTFCGDDPDLLTPLMAAQMSGRAGRRGLDEQGNLVYLGMPLPRVQSLMLGCIPAIRGEESRYPTMVLQHVLQLHYNGVYPDKSDRIRFFPVALKERRMRCISSAPLREWLEAKEQGKELPSFGSPDYLERSLRAMKALSLVEEVPMEDDPARIERRAAVRPGLIALIWELREYLPEGLAIAHTLSFMRKKTVPVLETKTKGVNFRYWAKKVKVDKLEGDFLTMLLPLVDRVPTSGGATRLQDESFIQSNPERLALLQEVEEKLRGLNKRLEKVDEPERRMLQLDNPPAEPGATPDMDSIMYRLVVMRKTPTSDPLLSGLSSFEWFRLKQRLWKLGNIIRQMHNCLNVLGGGDEKFAQILLWKTFRRVSWIMKDTFTGSTAAEISARAAEEEDNSDEEEEGEDGGTAEEKAGTPNGAAEPEAKV